MKKICFVTGTRADYGILYCLMKKFQEDKETEFQLIVTGTHLSSAYGNTIQEIERDQFPVSKKIDILLSSRSKVSVVKSLGLATIGFSEAFDELKPDLLIIIGDRFEILAAAQAALILNIPVAHLHGGELTQGAFDESIRHSLTKMSHLHFVSTESYKKRVIQLGETPTSVFNVGAPGIDRIKSVRTLTADELQKKLDLKISKPYFVVTYHPVTLAHEGGVEELKELLGALEKNLSSHDFIFTMPNADPDSQVFFDLMKKFCDHHGQRYFNSLGSLNYFSLLEHSAGVVGNSSSALIEAPYFNVPTVNIGKRQLGRVTGSSVINVDAKEFEIVKALKQATFMKGQEFRSSHLYGDGDGESSEKIFKIIKAIPDFMTFIQKKFHDLE